MRDNTFPSKTATSPELSDEESKVLTLLAQGMNTSEIAKRLSMSYRSVADINKSVKQKLRLGSFDKPEKSVADQ